MVVHEEGERIINERIGKERYYYMNSDFDKQDKIDRYILGELTRKELIAFEKEMQTDEILKKEVELTQHIANAFQRKGESKALDELMNITSLDELKKFVLDIEKDDKKQTKFNPKKIIISILSAAAILLFIYIGISPRYSSIQLFAEYYISEQMEILPSRGNIIEEEKQNELLYMKTLDLLENDELTVAIDNFIYLSSLTDFDYREEAQWGLALAYLKNNQRQEAWKILSDIKESNSYYADKAEELLDKLKVRTWF